MASRLIWKLPNADRGLAAKRLHERREIVGKAVVYRGIMEAWDDNHREVIAAFGSSQAFVDALRMVAPPTPRRRPLQLWRGVDGIGNICGPAWTADRDIACWFALRLSSARPLVFTTLADPHMIVTEHDGREEREVILDPLHIVAVLDPEEVPAEEVEEYVTPAAVLAEWRTAADRYRARRGQS
jgi:hypothetical protein